MRLADRFTQNEKKRGSRRSPRFLARVTGMEKLCRSKGKIESSFWTPEGRPRDVQVGTGQSRFPMSNMHFCILMNFPSLSSSVCLTRHVGWVGGSSINRLLHRLQNIQLGSSRGAGGLIDKSVICSFLVKGWECFGLYLEHRIVSEGVSRSTCEGEEFTSLQ